MAAPYGEYIRKYEPLWGSWRLDQLIGEGSFGKVYKIFKEEWGFRYESALKHITVPTREQFREADIAIKQQDTSKANYFEDAVKGIINEVRAMYTLKGNSNIVAYEDHLVEKRMEGIGWDIFIRMEYVVSLHDYLLDHTMTRKDILRMGIDICAALDLCGRMGIIHRDIKDDNIFISQNGCFKLGDFGISRELTSKGKAGSVKGTPLYMAPEIYKAESYDARADLYSLGIVLYRLLNYGRFPFMPPFPHEVLYKDTEAALEKRMSGSSVPYPPVRADTLTGTILLKAVSYRPEQRYNSAAAMRDHLSEALEALSTEEKNEIIIDVRKKTYEEKKVIRISGSGMEGLGGLGKSTELGNRNGNIVNGGLAAYKDRWIYYADLYDHALKKLNPISKEAAILDKDYPWFINVVNGWIYYSSGDHDDNLYRISIDGQRKEKLLAARCWDIQIYRGWIYYINESEGYSIYKIRLNGTENTQVGQDACNHLCVDENGIFYCNQEDRKSIYRLSHNGKDKKKLNCQPSGSLHIAAGWLYYINKEDRDKLYRMRPDGTESSVLAHDMCSSVNASGDWIYYSNKSDNGKLYRIHIDGGQPQKLNNEDTEYICIADQWIYYQCRGKKGTSYLMAPDGGSENLLDHQEATGEEEWIFL